MMAIWKIGPALATGNTIVLKPAESTPITTVKLAEYAGECLPKGVFNVTRATAGRRLPRNPPGHRHGVAHRLARYGQVDRGRRRRHAQARPPRSWEARRR